MVNPQTAPESLADAVARHKVARAVNFQQNGRHQEAESLFNEVLSQYPQHADALHYLGVLAHQSGRDALALELIGKSLALSPDNAVFHENAANVHLQREDLQQAVTCYQRALELNPQNLHCWVRLGGVLGKLELHKQAEHCYANALNLNRDDDEIWASLAHCLRRQDRLDEAVSIYLERLKHNSSNTRLLTEAGSALLQRGDVVQSMSAFKEAVRLDPNLAEAHYGLGATCAEEGDFSAAERHYREALRLDPASTLPYPTLAAITRFKGQEPLISEMEDRLQTVAHEDASNRINLHFALGKAYDDSGSYDASFDHYKQGNKLYRDQISYSSEAQRKFGNSVIRHFDQATVNTLTQSGLRSEAPIFIVGMPRSGTSLVEQIIASHPEVYGGGELTVIQRELMSVLGASSLKNLANMDAERFISIPGSRQTDIARKALLAMQHRAAGARLITDKMPQNFLLLGLLHGLFPDAKIIHCRRNPLDTCISCFTILFQEGQEFSYDLSELGDYYGMYTTLMTHWETVLPPNTILNIEYESVVDDIRGAAQRLLHHCGLRWDEACVSFHETKRPVRTASVYQVRQPLYKSSVGRWRRFEKHLRPLYASLEGNGVRLNR
jgi:tetratricopeptide (TPR) repeat protein